MSKVWNFCIGYRWRRCGKEEEKDKMEKEERKRRRKEKVREKGEKRKREDTVRKEGRKSRRRREGKKW